MKNLIVYVLLLLFVNCNNFEKSNANSINELKRSNDFVISNHVKLSEKVQQKIDTSEIILNIRKWFKSSVEEQYLYDKVEKELDDVTSEGGHLDEYYKDGEIKKKIFSLYGEMGKSILEFYFKENKLFFVFAQDFKYDKPMYIQGSEIKEKLENRYYFHEENLIRWMDSEKNIVSPNHPSFPAEEESVKAFLKIEN